MRDELEGLAFEGMAIVVVAPAATVAAVLAPGRLALPADEAARIARFLQPQDRAEREAAHGLLRHLLAPFLGCAPAAIVLARDAFGRPFLAESTGLDLNLSHGSGWVAVGLVPGGRIGVDVEGATRPVDWDALAPHFMHPAELAAYRALAPGMRPNRALEIWAVKEACLKAGGQGLSDPPQTVRLIPDPAGWRLTHRGLALRAASSVVAGTARLAWAVEEGVRPAILVAEADGRLRRPA